MTKNEANEKFLRWIEAHPSDEWRIVGGDNGADGYSATAVKTNDDEFLYDSCIFRWGRK